MKYYKDVTKYDEIALQTMHNVLNLINVTEM